MGKHTASSGRKDTYIELLHHSHLMSEVNMQGKVAVVTGASRGIGKSISLTLAQHGANVVLTDVNQIDLSKTAEQIRGKCTALKMDVTKQSQISEVVRDTLERFEAIDILVNNAGVSTMRPALELTEEDWDHNMNVNAKGVFLCSQLVAREMVKIGKGGRIINISSSCAKTGSPTLAHYCASKAAVMAFTKTLALELAPHKITVNAICPGFINTEMQDDELKWRQHLTGIAPEDTIKTMIARTPLGRLGEPSDVAKVVLFLCSSLSDYMTGQSINVTGGRVTD